MTHTYNANRGQHLHVILVDHKASAMFTGTDAAVSVDGNACASVTTREEESCLDADCSNVEDVGGVFSTCDGSASVGMDSIFYEVAAAWEDVIEVCPGDLYPFPRLTIAPTPGPATNPPSPRPSPTPTRRPSPRPTAPRPLSPRPTLRPTPQRPTTPRPSSPLPSPPRPSPPPTGTAATEAAFNPEIDDPNWPGQVPKLGTPNRLIINIQYDDYPREIDWVFSRALPNSSATWETVDEFVGATFQGEIGSLETYAQPNLNPNTQYRFTLEDKDGFCCDYGQGWVAVTTGTGVLWSLVGNDLTDGNVFVDIWVDGDGTVTTTFTPDEAPSESMSSTGGVSIGIPLPTQNDDSINNTPLPPTPLPPVSSPNSDAAASPIVPTTTTAANSPGGDGAGLFDEYFAGQPLEDVLWKPQAVLVASDAGHLEEDANFGYAMAVHGDTLVIGAPYYNDKMGAAYIYMRSNSSSSGGWVEQQKLVADDDANGESSGWFGEAVAIEGDTIVIGSFYGANGKGATYIFTQENGTWRETQKLVIPGAGIIDKFGESVAIHNGTIVIGEINGNDDKGAAYVFVKSGGNNVWTQQSQLVAPDGMEDHRFGYSVDISGDMILVGAPGYEYSTDIAGYAIVYQRVDGVWHAGKQITASDGVPDDEFGKSLAIDGNTIVVGNGHIGEGEASYVFVNVGNVVPIWMEVQKLNARGRAVAMDNGRILSYDTIFEQSTNGMWTVREKLMRPDHRDYGQSPFTVSIFGNTSVTAYSAYSAANSDNFVVVYSAGE